MSQLDIIDIDWTAIPLIESEESHSKKVTIETSINVQIYSFFFFAHTFVDKFALKYPHYAVNQEKKASFYRTRSKFKLFFHREKI
jgi:hypothetical protein